MFTLYTYIYYILYLYTYYIYMIWNVYQKAFFQDTKPNRTQKAFWTFLRTLPHINICVYTWYPRHLLRTSFLFLVLVKASLCFQLFTCLQYCKHFTISVNWMRRNFVEGETSGWSACFWSMYVTRILQLSKYNSVFSILNLQLFCQNCRNSAISIIY